jgi:hypothetical protein
LKEISLELCPDYNGALSADIDILRLFFQIADNPTEIVKMNDFFGHLHECNNY